MKRSAADTRTDERKAIDEQIAAAPPLPFPNLLEDIKPRPVEDFLPKRRKPFAVAGIVENDVVRPLNPEVKLTERSRVIIVAQEPA
jgi:hypothetical protein